MSVQLPEAQWQRGLKLEGLPAKGQRGTPVAERTPWVQRTPAAVVLLSSETANTCMHEFRGSGCLPELQLHCANCYMLHVLGTGPFCHPPYQNKRGGDGWNKDSRSAMMAPN